MAVQTEQKRLPKMHKLYCFDFDDNIVKTDCMIWTVDGPRSTSDLAKADSSLQLADKPFREFGPDNVNTCKIAPGPFLSTLRRALEDGSPIAIVSARSLNEEDFRKLLLRCTTQLLGIDVLHDHVHLYCCNCEEWALPGKEAPSRKCAAVAHFLLKYPKAVSIGFSDDDPKNLAAMRGLFAGLSVVRPDLQCKVYDANLDCASSTASP